MSPNTLENLTHFPIDAYGGLLTSQFFATGVAV